VIQTRTSPKIFAALCAIASGLLLNEQICNLVIPLSLHRFSIDARLIGLILAIHPAFGLVVQPLVGMWGDRIWTRLGRRATFLVIAAPLTAGCLVLMATAPRFGTYLSLLVLFQFCFAVLWGSDHPLTAELVPDAERPLVQGSVLASGQLASFLFVAWGVGYAMDRWGEASVYWMVAACQIVLVAGAALFLGEVPQRPRFRPQLTLRRYLRDSWGDPIFRQFALLGGVYAAFISSVSGFAVLFAVRTLGLSRAAFGQAWGIQSLLAICAAIPVGWMVARSSKRLALLMGFGCALFACLLALSADSQRSIAAIAVWYGFGILTIEVTLRPYLAEHLPRDIVGQLMGAYNFCYAAGRILALLGTGWAVASANGNYRVIWWVAIGCGVVGMVLTATLPDGRRRVRRLGQPLVAQTS